MWLFKIFMSSIEFSSLFETCFYFISSDSNGNHFIVIIIILFKLFLGYYGFIFVFYFKSMNSHKGKIDWVALEILAFVCCKACCPHHNNSNFICEYSRHGSEDKAVILIRTCMWKKPLHLFRRLEITVNQYEDRLKAFSAAGMKVTSFLCIVLERYPDDGGSKHF
jgi:hypothetical protein